MDGKLKHPRFVLCKKPQQRAPFKQEITIFQNVFKIAIFRLIALRGDHCKIFQNELIFKQILKNENYKACCSLILIILIFDIYYLNRKQEISVFTERFMLARLVLLLM